MQAGRVAVEVPAARRAPESSAAAGSARSGGAGRVVLASADTAASGLVAGSGVTIVAVVTIATVGAAVRRRDLDRGARQLKRHFSKVKIGPSTPTSRYARNTP